MKPIIAVLLFFSSLSVFALPLPKAGAFQIKQVDDKNILYVLHMEDQGHISNSLIKLIRYYLLRESDHYQVVFPQFSMESKKIKGQYYAIGYEGAPGETDEIKTTRLKGGLFASLVYKGNYREIGPAIGSVFEKISRMGKYAPHHDEEIRLLYWNSIDDNHPKDLITEIQVRVIKHP